MTLHSQISTAPKVSHPTGTMYLLMIDYGKQPRNGLGPYGREAVVNPEFTRRDIVSEVADILAKPRNREIAFVKFIDGNFIEDITLEIIEEAEALALQAAE